MGRLPIRAELQDPGQDRFDVGGKDQLPKTLQDGRAYLDSLGLCSFVREAFGMTEDPAGDSLEAVTGSPFTARLMEIGERMYSLERIILNREGIRRGDDQLPARITGDRVPAATAHRLGLDAQ
jgi:aldehyde:ferredoxin oxidoreductase